MANTPLKFRPRGSSGTWGGKGDFLMTRNDFGFRVRKLRHARHWTQSDLASQIGYSEVMVSYIENGQRSPSFEQILKLAEVFGVVPGELFSEEVSA